MGLAAQIISDYSASLSRGIEHLMRLDYSSARRDLDEAVRLIGNLTESHFFLAIACFGCGSCEEALRHLGTIPDGHPLSDEARELALRAKTLAELRVALLLPDDDDAKRMGERVREMWGEKGSCSHSHLRTELDMRKIEAQQPLDDCLRSRPGGSGRLAY